MFHNIKRKAKKNNLFFKESVIFFGFLNGIMFSLGLDIKGKVSEVLMPYVSSYGNTAVFVFTILPTILLAFSLYMIYRKARWLGLVSVMFGFVGGFFIITNTLYGLILLAIAWVIGYMAA